MVDEAARILDLNSLSKLSRMSEKCIRKYCPHVLDHINEFLNDEIKTYPLKHKICYYFHNLKTFPKCRICGQDCKRVINLFPVGFNEANLYTCSTKCALKYGAEKAKRTNIAKYGVSNVSKIKDIQEKKQQTCLQHYGVVNPSKSREIQDKKVETCLNKYGVENAMQNNDIKQKLKESVLNLYGVDNIMKCDYGVNALKKSNLKKYGSTWYLGTANCIEKTKETVKEKYGVEWITQRDDIREKISQANINRSLKDRIPEIISTYEFYQPTNIISKCYKRIECLNRYLQLTDNLELKERILILIKRYQNKIIDKYGKLDLTIDDINRVKLELFKNTCNAKYGVNNPAQLQDVKNKIIETCLQKFGTKYYAQCEKALKELHIKNMRKRYNIFLNNNYSEPQFTFEYYIDGHEDDILEWKCKKCGKLFKDHRRDYFYGVGRCLDCYPLSNNISKSEKEIVQFLKDIGVNNIIENSKTFIKGYEIDILCPNEKIAIEFDGLHWHTTEFVVDKNYHLHKTNLCLDNGYQLIHIFENEWLYKKDIVLSRIKSIFNKYDSKIFARKCIIKEVSENDKKDFLNKNHLQGNCISKYNIGLYYNNELVSIMTFGSYRYNLGRLSKENEYEMLRFCNKLNTTVVGGASRLLNHFIKTYHPIKIISYADKRWSIGKLYEKLGFIWRYDTQPNYYYNIKDHLENRFNWRKSELPNKLKIFDENLTEVQNMRNNGYYQIFDCGSKLYEITL